MSASPLSRISRAVIVSPSASLGLDTSNSPTKKSDTCCAVSASVAASRSARVARNHNVVVPINPATTLAATNPPVTTPTLCRCTNFCSRYPALGGRASTGSSARCRSRSRAKPFAEAYRRPGSFSNAFATIQSKSPRNARRSVAGCVCRAAAIPPCDAPRLSNRALGEGGSVC